MELREWRLNCKLREHHIVFLILQFLHFEFYDALSFLLSLIDRLGGLPSFDGSLDELDSFHLIAFSLR